MSVRVDVEASDRARAEGNAAFKKGKWVESIGHYTTSTVYNPSNPVGYNNRAQAYLKLEKFQDAERDCTTALNLEQGNLKALYRRALARRGLGEIEQAIDDLETLLRIDSRNSAGLTELEELRAIQAKNVQPAKPRLPPSPPKLLSPLPVSVQTSASASIPPQKVADDVTDNSERRNVKSPASEPGLTSSVTKEDLTNARTNPSFASLRKNRDGRKTFVNPKPPAASRSAGKTPSTSSESGSSSIPEGQVDAQGASSSSVSSSSVPPIPINTIKSTSTPTVPKARRPPSPPQDPQSTSPGSGIRLLRRLYECQSPSEASTLLSFYKPDILITILDGLLEPDTLAQITVALKDALSSSKETEMEMDLDGNTETETNPPGRDWVHEVMLGLKRTKRFGMNKAMLSKAERASGDRVWEMCGGVGSWV